VPRRIAAGHSCRSLRLWSRQRPDEDFDGYPPRRVEGEHNGRGWTGTGTARRFCDDSRGWMADVTWTEQHDWGPGRYLTMVPSERVRAAAGPRR
jgi:hypothetical protein